jgi:mono/diheme cytochrome c family protein
MRRMLVFVLAAVCVGISGCGAERSHPPSPARGPEVFARNCGGCHTLIGNESRHRQGGDLAGFSLSRATLLQFTREMPTRRRLSPAELQSVVDYVFAVEQRGRGPGL